MAKEKILDNKVMAFIESVGGWRVKYWAGSPYTKSGVPDILACINGEFYGIEDKDVKGKPTLLQLRTLQRIRVSGGIGILLYPGDFENFKSFVLYRDESATNWYIKNIAMQKKIFEDMQK